VMEGDEGVGGRGGGGGEGQGERGGGGGKGDGKCYLPGKGKERKKV